MEEKNWNLESQSEDNFSIKQQVERYLTHYKWFVFQMVYIRYYFH